MGWGRDQLFLSAVTYETGTGVFFFERGRDTWYMVVSGLPRDPTTDLRGYSWEASVGLQDRQVQIFNRDPAPRHPGARYVNVAVKAILRDRYFAHWAEKNAASWPA